MRETTALGAAIAAGLAVGIWHNFAELRNINRAGGSVFRPKISREKSAESFALWEKAVRMSRGWVGSGATSNEKTNGEGGKDHKVMEIGVKANNDGISSKIPAGGVFVDLDDADEEDLYLELRRVEIMQRLKKLRKAVGCFKR